MSFFITAIKRKKTKSDNGKTLYGICGILFILMSIVLSTIVMFLSRSEKVYEYSVVTIYMVAGYTFYRIGTSIYNFTKVKKYNDYVVRSLRYINLATALVSCLSLQSATLYAFSHGVKPNVMNALTGGIVCILIVIIGIFMTISAFYKPHLKEKNE